LHPHEPGLGVGNGSISVILEPFILRPDRFGCALSSKGRYESRDYQQGSQTF